MQQSVCDGASALIANVPHEETPWPVDPFEYVANTRMNHAAVVPKASPRTDPALLKLIAREHCWFDDLVSERAAWMVDA